MTWKLLTTPKTVAVDRRLATEFMEMEPAPHDRVLSERRLQVYERLFKAGQFRPCTWAKAFCEQTNGWYRVNGKHTSTLLSSLEYLPEFYVTIEEYTCQTLEDVANLYGTFDSKMQSRTATDIYMSFAATDSSLKELPQKIIVGCASGIPYHFHHEDMYKVLQPADRAEMLLEHVEFITWLSELLEGGQLAKEIGWRGCQRCPHLLRQAPIAAMFSCYQRDEKSCDKFWKMVRDENDAEPDAASRKLARYLVTTNMAGTKVGSGKMKGSIREMYCKCIHAWNSWRTGKATQMRYFPDAELPTAK